MLGEDYRCSCMVRLWMLLKMVDVVDIGWQGLMIDVPVYVVLD